jgi:sulfur-carrier protein
MAIVTLRYWAAAKEAAGVAEETVSAPTLAAALTAGLAAVQGRAQTGGLPGSGGLPGKGGLPGAGGLPGNRAEKLRLVLASASFLIDGEQVGTRPPESVTLADAAVIEVLPPFAGG